MHINYKSRNINLISSLSQAINLGLSKPYEVNIQGTPVKWNFITEYRCPESTNVFYVVDPSDFDPIKLTQQLINEYLVGTFAPLKMPEITAYIRELFMATSRTSGIWLKLYTLFVGKGDRNPTMSQIAKKDPEQVIKQVINGLPIFQSALGDLKLGLGAELEKRMILLGKEWLSGYLNSYFAKLGWLAPGIPTDMSMPLPHSKPNMDDLKAIVEAQELYTFVSKFEQVTVKPVVDLFGDGSSSHAQSKVRVNATTLAHTTMISVGMVAPMYRRNTDADAIVEALFYIARYVYYPMLDTDLDLGPDLLQSDLMASIATNLTMYHIHTTNVREGKDGYRMLFKNDTMRQYVLTVFQSAMAKFSPFKLESLADSTSTISRKSMKNHIDQPTLVTIAEAIAFKPQVDAFSVSRMSDWTFLNREYGIADRFEAVQTALLPYIDNKQLRSITRELHSQVPLDERLDVDGTLISIDLPSVYNLAARRNLDLDAVAAYCSPTASEADRVRALLTAVRLVALSEIRGAINVIENRIIVASLTDDYINQTDDLLETAGIIDEVVATSTFARVRNDLHHMRDGIYYKILSLAIRYSDEVHLIHQTGYDKMDVTGAKIGLAFLNRTNLMKPLGQDAILNGLVVTSEPLEALVYIRDFDRIAPLMHMVAGLPASVGKKHHNHAWNWHMASKNVEHSSAFTTKLRGRNYSVDLDQRYLLAISVPSKFDRRTVNPLLVANAYSVLSGMLNSVNELEAQVSIFKKKGKEDEAIALNGLILSILERIVGLITEISKTAMAVDMMRFVAANIRDKMRKLDLLDDQKEVHQLSFQLRLKTQAVATVLGYAVSPVLSELLLEFMKKFKKHGIWDSLIARNIDITG